MNVPCLQLHHLSKSYRAVTVLRDVSFTVAPGEIFGYLGPNGAGKTTTLRLILGLVQPTTGEVFMFGERAVPLAPPSVTIRQRIGFLPGELRLYPEMTGQALLDYFARYRSQRPPLLRTRLLEALALEPGTLQRRVKLLSHGTRQKLGLVIAMQHQPDLLFLDEPTLGLDPLMQRAFIELIKDLAHNGTTIFFSSHILSEIESLCDRVAILRAGELVALETIPKLREKVVRRMTLRFSDTPPAFGQTPGVVSCTAQGREVILFVQGDINALLQQLAQYHVEHLVFPEPELEDIFAHYYHGRQQSTAPLV